MCERSGASERISTTAQDGAPGRRRMVETALGKGKAAFFSVSAQSDVIHDETRFIGWASFFTPLTRQRRRQSITIRVWMLHNIRLPLDIHTTSLPPYGASVHGGHRGYHQHALVPPGNNPFVFTRETNSRRITKLSLRSGPLCGYMRTRAS